jgi:hypothetical protein
MRWNIDGSVAAPGINRHITPTKPSQWGGLHVRQLIESPISWSPFPAIIGFALFRFLGCLGSAARFF